MREGFAAPGQYVEARTAKGDGFFVLASDVGAMPWELLVRDTGGASEVLATAPLGATIELTGPLGRGFPMDQAAGRDLIIAVVGSALAAARPMVRHRLATAERASTTLYIGARTARDIPLLDEIDLWSHAAHLEKAGANDVTVVLCLSGPAALSNDMEVLPHVLRRSGYVQAVLAADITYARVKGGLVFAAGPEAMLMDLRDLAEKGPLGAARQQRTHGPREERGPGFALEVVTNI